MGSFFRRSTSRRNSFRYSTMSSYVNGLSSYDLADQRLTAASSSQCCPPRGPTRVPSRGPTRVHHRWTSPTAFTSAAMHPIEFAIYQGVMIVPLFFLPIHVVGLVFVLVYQNL